MSMVEPPPSAISLCQSISGFDDLSARQVCAAMQDLALTFGPDRVRELADRFEAEGAEALSAAPDLREMVQSLLLFLYTGFSTRPDAVANDPADHFESLMWRAALAHPPALSGGYFGHWSYPPEDAGP